MKSLRKNLVVLTVALLAGPILAQPAPDPRDPADATADAAVQGTTGVKLTVAEMTTRLAELDRQTEDDLRHVVRLQITARKEKDVIRLNCINDRLLQIKALRNLLQAAIEDFHAAVATNLADQQTHQFTKVTMSAENIRQLREEANGCAGENLQYVGSTLTTWTGPDIPDDMTDPFGTEIDEPGYASPFN